MCVDIYHLRPIQFEANLRCRKWLTGFFVEEEPLFKAMSNNATKTIITIEVLGNIEHFSRGDQKVQTHRHQELIWNILWWW